MPSGVLATLLGVTFAAPLSVHTWAGLASSLAGLRPRSFPAASAGSAELGVALGLLTGAGDAVLPTAGDCDRLFVASPAALTPVFGDEPLTGVPLSLTGADGADGADGDGAAGDGEAVMALISALVRSPLRSLLSGDGVHGDDKELNSSVLLVAPHFLGVVTGSSSTELFVGTRSSSWHP